MRPFTVRLLAVAGVAIGIGWSALQAEPATPEDSAQMAQKAIVRLSEHLKDKDVSDQAKKIVKEYDSCDISTIFAMKARGGLGIGKLTEAGFRDSVQNLIAMLSNRKNTTEQMFEQYQDDFLRVSRVMQAMAELAPHRATERIKKNEKLMKEWLETTTDFKYKTAAFRTAIEEKDPKKVRLAARELNNTCCHCHSLVDF
jgi:hypothetical protein